MKQDTEKYRHYILKNLANAIRVLKYIIFVTITVLGVKFSFRYLSPFIFALFLSLIIKPIATILQSFKFKKGLSVALSMILVYGVLVFLFFIAISYGLAELIELVNKIPFYSNRIYIYFTYLFREAEILYFQLPPDVITMILNLAKTFLDKVGAAMSGGTKAIINTISALPKLAIFLLISTVSTFFLVKDEDKIIDAVLSQLPTSAKEKLLSLKNNLFNALVGFLKALLILTTITFIESMIGLNILGIKYAFLISLVVAILDALPVVGTGSVYVPWAIISLVTGNTKLGISLLVLYGLIVVIRYLVEPKIMGHQLGIHPLLTLLSMFVGIKLFGVSGVILGPSIIVIIKAAQDSNILPKINS